MGQNSRRGIYKQSRVYIRLQYMMKSLLEKTLPLASFTKTSYWPNKNMKNDMEKIHYTNEENFNVSGEKFSDTK